MIKEGRNQRGVTNVDGGRAKFFYKPRQTFCGLAMTKRSKEYIYKHKETVNMKERERGIVWGAQKRNNSSNEMKLSKRKLRPNINI